LFKLKNLIIFNILVVIILIFFNGLNLGESQKLYNLIKEPRQLYITNKITIIETNIIKGEKLSYSEQDILYYKTKYIIESEGSKIPKYLKEIISNVIIFSSNEDFDPEIILSIIYVESSFNKFDHNSYGAKGLMQVVPEFLTDLTKMYNISKLEVYDIDKNIFMGTKQLGWFIKDSKGDLSLALYRYNGVKIRTLKDGRIVLPKEGFNYLVKIMNIYYKYKNIKIGE
jgi:soluble lytic murein transglycosylase-like protein